MGTLRSAFDHSGMIINDVALGSPVELEDDPATFVWDDARFPNGEINEDGSITMDEVLNGEY